MKITLNVTVRPFNLDYTLQCGQVFRWEKHGSWWYGVVAGKAIKIRQIRDVLEYEGARTDFIGKYFRLDDSLPVILSRISKDVYVRGVVRKFHGLRLINQDPWECLISYICATYKNIPAIEDMVNKLSKQFGSVMTLDNNRFYAFPSSNSLSSATISELVQCKLGFRAKSVHEAAKQVENGAVSFVELGSMSYEAAKRELLKLPGVGSKVADCVLLFSLNKLEAFPVDVWVKRTILNNYHEHFDDAFIRKASAKKSLTSGEYRRISSFAREYFGEYAGYAQQYLFHNERSACQRA